MAEDVYRDGEYFRTRFPYDETKESVWAAVAAYLDDRYGLDGTVVDIGAGYGYFLNNVDSDRRIAVDRSPVPLSAIDSDVGSLIGDASNLPLASDSADVVMVSNVLEHLTVPEIRTALEECQRVLAADGTLLVVSPNFALAPRQYFDDFTHETILTHRSLADLLTLGGFEQTDTVVRFLPFSSEGCLPTLPWLVTLYLRLPVSPFAGQSLLVATPA